MSGQPVIIVAGLGRCGTSLVMQMLAAAGVPCAGDAPAYECDETVQHSIDPLWFCHLAGRAVKVLDPHRNRIPRVDSRVIWLDRSRDQQARSQLKFLATVFPASISQSRDERRRMASGLAGHRAAALTAIGGRPLVLVRFEELIERPQRAAERIATFLAPWRQLDSAKMASVVLQRSAECAPDMSIELALVHQADAA